MRRVGLALTFALAALAQDLSATGTSAELGPRSATTVPGAPGCPMFPANNIWNTPIDTLPVDAHSAQWLASMDASRTFLHPDFGSSGDAGSSFVSIRAGRGRMSSQPASGGSAPRSGEAPASCAGPTHASATA